MFDCFNYELICLLICTVQIYPAGAPCAAPIMNAHVERIERYQVNSIVLSCIYHIQHMYSQYFIPNILYSNILSTVSLL